MNCVKNKEIKIKTHVAFTTNKNILSYIFGQLKKQFLLFLLILTYTLNASNTNLSFTVSCSFHSDVE